MSKRSFAALAFVPILLAGCSQPAEEGNPPVVENMLGGGVELLETFPAPGGLTGYVVGVDGRTEIMYLTPDREHVIIGVMVDAEGDNVTLQHVEQYAPKPDYAAHWEKVENATWVAEGAQQPESVVYVLADPYCPYCHALWKATQPYQAAGLQVRWLLVSYLREDGAAKAATILDAENPAQALKQHEESFPEGGIAPDPEPNPETLKRVEANTQLMQELGITGTPTILFKDAEGQVQIVQGMPRLGVLPEIFQLPEQPIEDPELARFR